MGTPAWQKREYERQEFLENLYQEFLRIVGVECERRARLISNIEETAVHFSAAGDLLEHIRQMRYMGHLRHDSGGDSFHGRFGDEKLATVLDKIKKFSKTVEESVVLQVRFLERIQKTAFSQFHSLLERQELEHPELIYGQYGRTDEVPE